MYWFFFYIQNNPEVGQVLLSPLGEPRKKVGHLRSETTRLVPTIKIENMLPFSSASVLRSHLYPVLVQM